MDHTNFETRTATKGYHPTLSEAVDFERRLKEALLMPPAELQSRTKANDVTGLDALIARAISQAHFGKYRELRSLKALFQDNGTGH